MMEIARAVSFEARLIVMDEPTASLSRHELEPLFRGLNVCVVKVWRCCSLAITWKKFLKLLMR